VWAKQCYAWQPQASRSATGGSDIEYTYRVVRPLTTILTKHPPGRSAKRSRCSRSR
jgi:hypothetical protein